MANTRFLNKKLVIAAVLSVWLFSAFLEGSMSLGTPIAFAQSSDHTSSNHAQQNSMQAVYDVNGRIVGYFIPANSTQQGSTREGQMGGSTVGSSVIDLTLAATIAASVGVGGFAAYKVYEIKQKAKMKTKAA